ncbi:MAG TPA: aspartate 1-decarboxylase [Candidatus Methanomethylophilaceae archaeon]|nr:aspartate 1-decarboxylase [Candidatus Methanomethylophilaceae archaeon]
MRWMLRSKIHRATVTETCLDYEGSITVDGKLLDLAGILEGEKVTIANITNGNRFETYTIRGKEDSGEVCINGAAAHLCDVGDLIIVMGYELADGLIETKIVKVDSSNKPMVNKC